MCVFISFQVAPTPFTPTLSNRELYPYVFRIRAALTTFNPTRVAFIKSLGWKRVAIITRQTDYFLQVEPVINFSIKCCVHRPSSGLISWSSTQVLLGISGTLCAGSFPKSIAFVSTYALKGTNTQNSRHLGKEISEIMVQI